VSKKALGKGLDALIPRGVMASLDVDKMTQIPLERIRANPNQPRKRFDGERMHALAESIRTDGVLQPVVVRKTGDHYELIMGERRLQAARLAGVPSIPAVVRTATDADTLRLALVENLQREDLNPIEVAEAYKGLSEKFGLSHQELAGMVGKDRSSVANTLRLLALPESVQHDIERGMLSAGHARALVNVGPEALQLELAREVVARRLTVRQTEQMAKVRATSEPDADHRAAEHRLTEALGTRVRIVIRKNASGRIEIEYHSLAALNDLIDRLCGT